MRPSASSFAAKDRASRRGEDRADPCVSICQAFAGRCPSLESILSVLGQRAAIRQQSNRSLENNLPTQSRRRLPHSFQLQGFFGTDGQKDCRSGSLSQTHASRSPGGSRGVASDRSGSKCCSRRIFNCSGSGSGSGGQSTLE